MTTPPYLSGSDLVAINKHGRLIGFYVPLERDEHAVRRAIAPLGESVGKVLEETRMTEDDVAALFELRAPPAQ